MRTPNKSRPGLEAGGGGGIPEAPPARGLMPWPSLGHNAAALGSPPLGTRPGGHMGAAGNSDVSAEGTGIRKLIKLMYLQGLGRQRPATSGVALPAALLIPGEVSLAGPDRTSAHCHGRTTLVQACCCASSLRLVVGVPCPARTLVGGSIHAMWVAIRNPYR